LEQQNITKEKKKVTTTKSITFTTFKLVGSVEPQAQKKFNPTVTSDEQIMDLYNEVSKEATNRWKKALSERTQIKARRIKEKQILNNYINLAKEKLGIDHLTEGVDPLIAMRSLIQEVISTRENNQEEI
jgi:hypothetical protein